MVNHSVSWLWADGKRSRLGARALCEALGRSTDAAPELHLAHFAVLLYIFRTNGDASVLSCAIRALERAVPVDDLLSHPDYIAAQCFAVAELDARGVPADSGESRMVYGLIRLADTTLARYEPVHGLHLRLRLAVVSCSRRKMGE